MPGSRTRLTRDPSEFDRAPTDVGISARTDGSLGVLFFYRLENLQCGSVSLVSATWALPSPPTWYAPGMMWWFGIAAPPRLDHCRRPELHWPRAPKAPLAARTSSLPCWRMTRRWTRSWWARMGSSRG